MSGPWKMWPVPNPASRPERETAVRAPRQPKPPRVYALEISGPHATCGHCNFTARLTGTWSVENEQLVWRADPDPLTSRGPGLESCCESDPVVEFGGIRVDGRSLSPEEVEDLRDTAKDESFKAFRRNL